MNYQSNLTNELIELKSRAIAVASMANAAIITLLLIFFIMNPESIPKDELNLDQLTALCVPVISGFLISWLFARKKMSKISYVLFFSTYFLGTLYAFTLKHNLFQVQNFFIILLVIIFMAIVFVEIKTLIILNVATIIMINFEIFYHGHTPIDILSAYIFFHFGCIVSIVVALYRRKIEKIILITSTRDAKLKEIGFVAGSVAHEIGNPLNIVSNSLNLLINKINNEESLDSQREDLNQFIHLAHRNTTRISDIIKSIYALVQRSNQPYLPMLNNAFLFNELKPNIDILKSQLNAQIILNQIDENIFIEAFHTEILQILVNLIRNAAESVSKIPDGKVWIESRYNQYEYSIHVKDNGPGLSKDVIRSLGDAFNSGTSEGLGLGLSISLNLADRNNGKLEYKHNDEGPCFSLTLKRLNIPFNIMPDQILNYKSSQYAHLLKLRNDLIFVYMRNGEYTVNEKEFKELIHEEMSMFDVFPVQIIVLSNECDLTPEARKFLNSEIVLQHFSNIAIVGNSQYVNNIFNFLNKILYLAARIKLFKTYADALSWIDQKRD